MAIRALLAYPTTLPDFGVVPEFTGKYALWRRNDETGQEILLSAGSTAAQNPSDLVRKEILYTSGRLAMIFILGHELGHIWDGHLDGFLARDVQERRTRELIADYKAAIFSFLVLSDTTLSELVEHRKYYLWGFAVGIWAALMETFSMQDIADGRAFISRFSDVSAYPRGRLRAEFACGLMTSLGTDDFLREAGRQAADGCNAAYQAWEAAEWPPVRPVTREELIEVGCGSFEVS